MLTRPNSSKVRSPNMAGSLLPDKGSLPPDMRSGQLATTKDFNDTLSRQKLRLSAEGLLDIVTDQYLDSKVLKDGGKKNSSAVATGDPSMKRNPSEGKAMTILTPIITENSEPKHPDSSPEAGEKPGQQLTQPQLECKTRSGADLAAPEHDKSPPNAMPADFQKMVNKRQQLKHPAESQR